MKKTILALAVAIVPATAMAQSTALDVFESEQNASTPIDERDTRSISNQTETMTTDERGPRLGDGSPNYGRF